MAATITKLVRDHGKAADTITITGTGFTDAPTMSAVLVRKFGDTAWVAVNASRVAYTSGTVLVLTLHATEFDEGGFWDIGVADNAEVTPDDYLAQGLYFYATAADVPDNFIKGAPLAVYVDGAYVGQTHGGLNMSHPVETSDIESDQSLVPLRTIKIKEEFTVTVPLGEVSLENIKRIWGLSATISADRMLTFGGDTDLPIQEVMIFLPAGSSKEWSMQLYRCTITSPGDLNWNRDDQVDLPLQIKALADTSRTAGDQVGRIYEYTPA